MAAEWSGLASEVLLTLDRSRPVPLRAQLEDQFRQAIRSGRLGAGDRVPSSRALAKALGLSRGLVQECYAQLLAEGYLVTRGGSATQVATAATIRPNASPRSLSPPARPRHAIADFRSGIPDLGRAPREDWAWAIREVCRTIPNAAFDYPDPLGEPRLRDVLAAYLRRVRAASATGDQLIICIGMAQALEVVLNALAGTGIDTLAFEDPGAGAWTTALASQAGMYVVPITVDENGLDVAALDRSRARAVLVTPAHQWPTGVVLAPERRLALIDWAASPPGLAATLARTKQFTDRGSPGLDQLALALLIETGRYDRHLRRMRAEYAARREVLVQALAEHAPGVRLTGLAAGFHAVAHLPAGTAEQEVIQAARSRSVGLYGMSTESA